MEVEVVEARPADRAQLTGLLDPYLRESARHCDVAVGVTGAADYPYADAYFVEAGRHAFLIRYRSNLVGFALVRGPQSTGATWHIAELYVIPASRRCGVGRAAVLATWRRFAGDWQLQVHARNSGALDFWLSCVAAATQLAPRTQEVQASDGKRIQLNFHSTSTSN